VQHVRCNFLHRAELFRALVHEKNGTLIAALFETCVGGVMARSEMIFSLIKADHKEVEELFARIEKTTERAAKTRQRLYAKLRDAITRHSDAEETAVYPRLKQKSGTQEIAFESIEEHDVAKFLLRKLDATPYDSREWTAQICVLQENIEKHVEEEEGEMFKLMKRALSQEELQMMAADFEQAKMGFLERIENFLNPDNELGRERAA